jgi:thymidylate synthase (FAD)
MGSGDIVHLVLPVGLGQDGGEDAEPQILDPNKTGLARELARMNLTLNFYTQWYWKIDLHNLLHFCSLRADPHAQYEIRAYADVLLETVKRWVPYTYEAFTQYRQGAVMLSAQAMKIVQRMLKGEKVSEADSGLGKREWREFCEAMGLDANGQTSAQSKVA